MNALRELAAELDVPPSWLERLIQFESGWDPWARNPRSGARGLIQFTNSTARALGYASADDLVAHNPTVETQLRGPVLSYLVPFAPYPTEQSLCMAVFYPRARNWPADRRFPEAVISDNPGIATPADYMARVGRAAVVRTISLSAIVFVLLLSAVVLTTRTRGRSANV